MKNDTIITLRCTKELRDKLRAAAAAHLHQKLFDACEIFRKEEPAPLVDAEVVS